MKGIIYGIGVGPGDSELITLKAINVLSTIDIVVTPVSKMGNRSKALSIAKPFIRDDVEIIELEFPMIDLHNQKESLLVKWKENAWRIAEYVKSGKKVAFLTLGDPMVYSTYSYLIPFLRDEDINPITIPGITSFCAAAAEVGVPIVQGSEKYCLLTKVSSLEELEGYMREFDNIVIMKPKSSIASINEGIKKYDLHDKVFAISNCGGDGQVITTGIVSSDIGYFTIILMKLR